MHAAGSARASSRPARRPGPRFYVSAVRARPCLTLMAARHVIRARGRRGVVAGRRVAGPDAGVGRVGVVLDYRAGSAALGRASKGCAYIAAERPENTGRGRCLGCPTSTFGCLALSLTSAGHLESYHLQDTTMARADDVLRRRRRFDVLPLLIPAIALLTTTTRRRDPIVNYDAWHTCVLEGCASPMQANEAHSFPYLATFVSMFFLFGIMVAWQAIAQEGQSTLMGIKPGPGGGGTHDLVMDE